MAEKPYHGSTGSPLQLRTNRQTDDDPLRKGRVTADDTTTQTETTQTKTPTPGRWRRHQTAQYAITDPCHPAGQPL